MEPEICTKMLKKLSEKLRAKFPATTHGYSMEDASGKKGKLLCCKCLLEQIKANLAEIQPENHKNVQKNAFLTKSSESQWVKDLTFKVNYVVL